MPSRPVSVITTVRNEAAHVDALLASLEGQEGLHEVIVVDAASEDGTVAVARKHGEGLPRIQIISRPCTRGEGRNIGAGLATGELLAFIDGDCVARPGWVAALRDTWDGKERAVVAGDTQYDGPRRFRRMQRVGLEHHGQDATWPSCNLAYPRKLFAELGGFDERFVTAEDIDLNLRAIRAGAQIHYASDAVVVARTRRSTREFLRQAYWNGYGRKQLAQKHGNLWPHYGMTRILRRQGTSFWAVTRLAAGGLGYWSARRQGGGL